MSSRREPQGATQELLAVGAAVDVRGVEEGDARVERAADDRSGRVVVDASAEVVAAETDDGDLE